jgi:hypothetical protein
VHQEGAQSLERETQIIPGVGPGKETPLHPMGQSYFLDYRIRKLIYPPENSEN